MMITMMMSILSMIMVVIIMIIKMIMMMIMMMEIVVAIMMNMMMIRWRRRKEENIFGCERGLTFRFFSPNLVYLHVACVKEILSIIKRLKIKYAHQIFYRCNAK